MRKKWLPRLAWSFLGLFAALNFVAALHAYKFTHFAANAGPKPSAGKHYSLGEKVSMALAGVNNPRPVTGPPPAVPFQEIILQSRKKLSAWFIPTDQPVKGSVALFHGYGGEKSSMLDKAMLFRQWGYHTLLVDMQGAGSSEGNQCTIGFHEAEDVAAAFKWLKQRGPEPVYLMGTSMGAAAILRALSEQMVQPEAAVLECPFGSLYRTVEARFAMQGIPPFPMAGLLVFWGGALNKFWAFGHQPQDYAEQVHSPTLLMYGAKDQKVSMVETQSIFERLKGPKQLVVFPNAGHENYLRRYQTEWELATQRFFERSSLPQP